MSAQQILSTRTFVAGDQTSFAELSGDWNPMHVDAVAARRTPPGAPVVHGMHLLLWAVEALAAHISDGQRCLRLKARFLKWVHLETSVEVVVASRNQNGVRLQLRADGTQIVTADLELAEAGPGAHVSRSSAPKVFVQASRIPRSMSVGDLQGASGLVPSASDPSEVRNTFPEVVRLMGSDQVCALLCT